MLKFNTAVSPSGVAVIHQNSAKPSRKLQLLAVTMSTALLLVGCGSQTDTLAATGTTGAAAAKPVSRPASEAPNVSTTTPAVSTPAPTSPVTTPVTTPPVSVQNTKMYGVVGSQLSRLKTDYAAGIRIRSLELAWDAAETGDDQWNTEYFATKKAELAADIAAGYKVDLNLGIQYPPQWLLAQPDTHFVDQHGTVYNNTQPGTNPLNPVFSQAVRNQQAAYIHHVFEALGSNFASVRLGFGYYGEIGYPPVAPGANSYWGFDAVATGQRPGLAHGLTPNPVPNWQAVTGESAVTPDEQLRARQLATWYLGALGNYQDWQIQTVRRDFAGRLLMLYPSFGMRPGQAEQAIQDGLRGRTSPEINGELQRGFDFAGLVNRLQDPKVSPYTTWLDADGTFVDDSSSNISMWSPVHYLAYLSAQHPLNLQVWGENTGANSRADLERCAQRAKQYHLGGMFWAFNEQLYDGRHASIDDVSQVVAY